MTTRIRCGSVNGLFVLAVAWVILIGGGALVLGHYALAPGQPGTPPLQFPVDADGRLETGRPTLLLFAHPRCPCTRATLGELARLLSKRERLLTARVLFFKPSGSTSDWEQTDLWRTAQAIPGVRVEADIDGIEAARFDVKTSGHVLLYDPAGRLLYSGGITGARGHEGDNTGLDAVLTLLQYGSASCPTSAVFGCPLHTSPVICSE